MNNQDRVIHGVGQPCPGYFTNWVGTPGGPLLEANADGGASGGDGNSGDGGDGSSSNNDANAGGEEPRFTQAQLDNHIKARLDRAEKKWKQEAANTEQDVYSKLGIKGPEDLDRLHKVMEDAEKADQRKLEEKGLYEKSLAEKEKSFQAKLQEKDLETSAWKGKYEGLSKETQLTRAAIDAGANPQSLPFIIKYAQDSVKVLENGSLQVLDEHGEPMLSADNLSKEVTVKEYIAQILNQNPELAKSSGTQGAGSGKSAKVGKYTVEDITNIAATDLAKYKELVKDGTVAAVMKKHAESIN